MNWIARYIGVPFLDGGRSLSGYDCWGLVQVVFLNERGIELPSYGEISAHDLIRVARKIEQETVGERGPWVEVVRSALRPFDVVVMYRRRLAAHVGLVALPGKMLHVAEAQHTVLVPIDSPHVNLYPRVKFFRHEALAL